MEPLELTAIGGTHDRRKIKATPCLGPSGPYIHARAISPLRSIHEAIDRATASDWAPDPVTETYELETVHFTPPGGDAPKYYMFWVAKSLSLAEAFDILMRGYAK